MRLFVLFAASVLLAQAPESASPYATPNAFAASYNEWGRLYEARVMRLGPRGVDLKEKRAFDTMNDRWNELRKFERQQF